jgi:HK97 family phage portal protein
MAESFMGFLRETLAAWMRPRALPRPIQFSTHLANMSPMLADAIGEGGGYTRAIRLGRLIGHYGDEVWVYVAVSKVAQAAASVPLRARRGDPEDEESEILTSGPLPELLARPNPYQSHFDFVEQHQTSMDLAGESFIYLDRGPSATGGVDAMYVLPIFNEQTMTVVRKSKKFDPAAEVAGYIYQVGNEKISYLPDEIVHVRYPNPFDPYRGLAPLRAAALSVESDLMAQQYNAAFFVNSAEPRGHYEAEGVVLDAQYKRFQKLIEARHRGYHKAHRPLILQNMKWVSTQLSPKDSEFLEQRKFSREEIIAIYGVRPVVVGLLEHNPQANAEIQWRDFWSASMQPKMAKLVNALNGELAPIFGEGLVIEWDFSRIGPLQENYSQKVSDAEKLNRMGYPINAINRRLNLGFEDMPWGDTVFVNPLLVPVDEFTNGNGNGKSNGNGRGFQSQAVRELEAPPALLLSGYSGGRLEERKRVVLSGFEIRQTRQECKAQIKIADFFRAQERRTLRNLRSEGALRALDPVRAAKVDDKRPAGVDLSVVFDIKEETEKMQPLNREILRRAMVDAMLTFIAQMGQNEDDFDFVSPAVLKFLQTDSFRHAKNTTEYTRELLATEFTEGINAGETIGELAARVEKVFDERVSSSETIARTETVGASNFGNQEAALQAGIQTKSWISSRDERVRDEHTEIDDRTTAEPIPVTMPFRLADGSELQYPGDSSLGADPGQIINCRCTTLYFFED